VTALGELARHDVQEEEMEIFDKLRDAGIELDALGEKGDKRKEELAKRPTLEETLRW